MKKEVQKWQNSPDMNSPLMTPRTDASAEVGTLLEGEPQGAEMHRRTRSVDTIPLLNESVGATGLDGGAKDVARERKIGDLPS